MSCFIQHMWMGFTRIYHVAFYRLNKVVSI